MIQQFNLTLPGFLKHSYDTRHQYQAVQNIEFNLLFNQVKLLIDFSQLKMHVFHITQTDIENIDKLLRPHIKHAPKSQQIFQILWIKNKRDFLFLNYLPYTNLSCINNPSCTHFSLI